ncbi:MAG TPA: hypothetical protein VK790_00230 [Solirubrobacteraceae bacterium]|nr:hypothetical protein [Solirubrobacteraceae bacterium]
MFGALTAPAFAKEKAKMVFGEFVAGVAGKNLATEPGTLMVNKEDEPEVTALELGNYKFGTLENPATGEIDFEEPCEKAPKVTGRVDAEKSPTLSLNIAFRHCVAWAEAGGVELEAPTHLTLAMTFNANHSAELGAAVELPKQSVVFRGAFKKCPVEIPAQTIPVKAAEDPEKEYEAAAYTNEAPEAIENWEKSKKLKEQFPSGFKERLEVELVEIKRIVTYVKAEKPCVPKKGAENGKLITEGEHAGWLEYTNGRIEADIEGLEVKGGELKFEPAA